MAGVARRCVLLLALLTGTLPPATTTEEGRDGWQRPAEVLDALGVEEESVVADIGCGRGYFTAHLARRVGPGGRVYAIDVDAEALAAVERLVERNRFQQVKIVRGQADDPQLPADVLDVALVVDTYHEFTEPEAMLAKIFAALKPGGRLGIIDRVTEPGQERAHYRRRHRIPPEVVEEETARHGFVFLREAPGFIRPRDSLAMYFLIFQKPVPPD